MVFRIVPSVVALLLPALVAADVFDRPLDLVYALLGNKGLNYSDAQYLDYFDDVKPYPITAMVPFFLNVENPGDYESMLNSLSQRNITIVPAVGFNPFEDGDINADKNKDIAMGYSKYSSYIRLENLQGVYDQYGSGGIQDMINFCSLHFDHIMMNPW